MPLTLQQHLSDIRDSLNRGKGSFGIAPTPGSPKATLAVGAPTQIKVGGGRIIAIGLDAEQVRILRNQCDEVLALIGAAS